MKLIKMKWIPPGIINRCKKEREEASQPSVHSGSVTRFWTQTGGWKEVGTAIFQKDGWLSRFS